MSEPTPGPWEVREVDGLIAIAHAYGWVLESNNVEQDRADARLIAAAPELLASLKELTEHSQKMGRESKMYERAQALIRKIEG